MKKILILLTLICVSISPAFLGCNPAAYNPPPGPPGTCVGKHTEQGLFGTIHYVRIRPSNDKYETWDWFVDAVEYDRWNEGDRLYWPNYKGNWYK